MSVSFIIILGVLIVLALLIFKSHDFLILFNLVKRYFMTIMVLSVLAFFAFSLWHVSVKYNLKFSSYADMTSSGKVYLTWFKSLFMNIGDITGYASKKDWILNSAQNLTR